MKVKIVSHKETQYLKYCSAKDISGLFKLDTEKATSRTKYIKLRVFYDIAFADAITASDYNDFKTKFWNKNSLTILNERQVKIINRLFDGFEGKLTTSKWAKMCNCSQDTETRDIMDLISKNILEIGRIN